MKRRIIAMLLAIVMLVGNVPVQAFATEAEPQETLACVTEGCTYGAGHTGECSTFVACGKDGCTFAAGHEGNCSNYVASEDPKAEPAADAAVYVTVSDRGELGMAYEEVTVSDINRDGKLTVDEALYAAHTVYGKSYASENGAVTKLWDEETSNVSFFLNHAPLSTDVSVDTVSDGDYLVASVDQDAVNDYDKYSRFDVMEKSVSAGSEFTLTLTDDTGNALAGMEIGLSNGNGSTTMTGLTTDVNGSVTLTLDQEGMYCVTAKGTVVESSIDVNTMEITSIETPIIAPVCVVTVSGNAVQQPAQIIAEAVTVQAPVMLASVPSTVSEGDTELTVSGATITMASGSMAGPMTLTSFSIYKQNDYKKAPVILSATQNGTTVNVTLAEDTDPSYPLQLGFTATGSGVLKQTGNTCTLNAGQGTMNVLLQVYANYGAQQPMAQATYTVNFSIPMGEAVTVTPPAGEGFVFTGEDSAYKDQEYIFTVTVNEGYDGSKMVVKINDEPVLGDNGTYTVASVPGDLTINVEGIDKKELCTVTLMEGEGYTISSDDIPYKGEDYTFSVAVDTANHKADTLKVLLDGEPMIGENGVYTIPALAADHEVTVTVEKKAEYTVNWNELAGVTITGEKTVLETDPYTFTVQVDNAYDASGMKILVNDQKVTLQEDGSYTIDSVDGDIAITVEGVEAKVIYTVSLTEGENYTISGQDTSYAGEAYTFTITVDDAIYFADQIQVKVNGTEIELKEDGTYTFEALDGDKTVTVENVVERKLCNITKPEVDGVTFTGADSVREGKPYAFSIAVANSHLSTDMVVKVNGAEVSLENGSHTIEAAAGDMEITVEGVRPKEEYTVTKNAPEGVTIDGSETVLETDPYTFNVTVAEGYDAANMVVKVAVGEEPVDVSNGYSIASVTGNVTITVTGVVKKQQCKITLPTGKGYTVTGAATAYAGDSYSFTVAVSAGYVSSNMVVTANGETVTGSNGSYTITVEGDTEISVIGVEREPLPEKELTVADNVIDITDKIVLNYRNIYYAKAVNVAVTGVNVKNAYENGTTVYVVLPSDTADDAQVGITFGTALDRNCTMDGTTGSLALADGEGSLSMTLTGKYRSSGTGTATYTLIFIREAAATEVPVRIQETDSAEMYRGQNITLDLDDYFNGEETYYLVESAGNTPVEMQYTFVPEEAGTYTLVFGAANAVGDCPEYVTVTVTVKDVESGVWIGHTTSNGALNYVTFTDADGNSIEGIDVSYADCKIRATLPKTYDANGRITAAFDLTQNSSGLPFITTSNQAAGSSTAAKNKFTAKTTTLSNGAGTLTFYLYNAEPKATSNSYTTFTVTYAVRNDLPVLAEGVSATAEATITAGQNYTLDLPSLFTDADGDSLTYLVSIDGAAAVAAEADYSYTTNTAGTYTLVFTANDGKGTSTATYTVTLTVEDADTTYAMTANLPEGLNPKFYVCSGYGEDGLDQLGAEVETVAGEAANGTVAYTLNYPTNASAISVRAEEWGGMSFAAEKNAAVTLRQVQMNVVDYDNKAAESTNTVSYDGHTAASGTNGWLLVTGQEYTYTAAPKDTATLETASTTEKLEAGEGIHQQQLMLGIKNPITITVTTGATARLYNYDTNKYYYATEFEPKIIADNGDGTTTYSFVGSGSCLIYRVSMEGKVTKAGYFGWNQRSVNAVYDADDVASSYRQDDYSGTNSANSGMTEDSVVLNVNGQNHLSMNVGDSRTLKAYRIWEIIKISYQNYIITPDFTFNILSGSDVVSLEEKDSPSVGDGDWMTLTALKEGTAVIEVTYGAMEIAGGSYDGIYGASDPARTGLVVVQVGGNDASVNFGIDSFASRGKSYSDHIAYNSSAKRAWDAEFDTLYFTGSSGLLKLSPTAASAIKEVAVSHDKGGSWTQLTAQEGVYTAPIVSGNNILRITTEAGVAYQVVRGDRITVQISDVGDSSDGDGKIEPGETARITLNGLHMPIPKMAGNYNPGFGGNSDGYSSVHLNYTANGQAVHGPGTQYTFINDANYLDIAIPTDIQTDKLTLTDGYIGVGVVGLTQFDVGGDSHRNIPDSGCNTRGNQTTFHTRSILPEITIPLEGVEVPVSVTGVSLDKTELTLNKGDTETLTAKVAPENADNKNVTWSSSNSAVATAAGGVVNAVGKGTATITVTTEDGAFTATCEVTVKQPVESVSIIPESAEVEVGKTVELTASVLPEDATDKTVTWKSSDETVATVDVNGKVTGVKAGSATITATTTDGSKTATCAVTVKDNGYIIETGKTITEEQFVCLSKIALSGVKVEYQKGADPCLLTLDSSTDLNKSLTVKLFAAGTIPEGYPFVFYCNDQHGNIITSIEDTASFTIPAIGAAGWAVVEVGIALDMSALGMEGIMPVSSSKLMLRVDGVDTAYSIWTEQTADTRSGELVSLPVIRLKGVTVQECSGSDRSWKVTLPENTDKSQDITVEIVDYWVQGNFATSASAYACNDVRNTTGSFQIVPDWSNGNSATLNLSIVPLEDTIIMRGTTLTLEILCDHSWNDATCIAPKTCSKCGTTEGSADETAHSYVGGTCEHCGAADSNASAGFDIVTNDDLNGNYDVRASNIHIGTAGSLLSNTVSEDGKATVLITEDAAELEITLSLFAKSKNIIKKGYVALNGGTPTIAENIDETAFTSTWTTTIPTEWDANNEMTVSFEVGMYMSNKFKDSKIYTLTLKKVGDTTGNTAPSIAETAPTTGTANQYSWYELDLGTVFEDTETEDSKLIYQVNTDGEWKNANQSYSYLPKTSGTKELKFKAKDAVGADSPEHTITLTISQYQAPEHGLLIGNVTDNGVLKSLTIQDASGNVLPVEFDVNGQEITVYLPGDQVGGNDTVKAVFDLEQVNDLPFLSKNYEASQARLNSTSVFETVLSSYSGCVTAYYWTSEPGSAENRNGYTITYRKLVGENQAPALADGVEATVTDSIAQYQTWSVDLSKIFTEPDEEAMTYTVSVNNGAAKDTDASYSYECSESGTVNFVFKAADPSGLTATYKVTLTVTPVPRTVVSTELTNETANGVFCKGIQVTGYTLNSRVTHYAADQHKITFLLQSTEDDASVELEFLSDFQDYVMYYYASQSGKPTLESSERVTGPYTVTLENGEKILYLATTTAAKNERQDYQLIFRNQNNAPAPVNTTYSDTCTVQAPYKFDLSDKFSDQNNDPLDYYVSVNGGDKQMIDAQWEYTAGTTGVHTLVFTASDGFVDSEPYTVTLNAEISEDVYTVDVKLPETVNPAFYITDSMNGETGDVLGNPIGSIVGETTDGWTTHQVLIPDNISRISIRGTTTENEETVNWGGMSIVTKDAEVNPITDTVVLRQVKGVIDSQFDGKAPVEADAKFVIQTQDGEYPVSGSAYEENGYLTYRYLLVAQDGYTYSTVATGSLAEKYGTKVSESTYSLTTDEVDPAILKLFIDLKNGMYVTVPQGSVVHTGKMSNYFKYYFFDEYYRMDENQDGMVTYIFEVPAKANPDGTLGGEEFIRVQHPRGVTYWTYDDKVLTAGGELTLTDEDLFIGSSSYNSKTVIHDLSEIPTDVADIYLSINKQMYLDLDAGESYKLNVFRNWQAVEGLNNAKTALPDVHYAVISLTGGASDVVTVTTDEFNSSVATVTANKAGTAIVLVTYDAMYSTQVCSDAAGYSGKAAKLSAIWPENTGVFVVSVGADGSSIVTNIDVDAEHDPIYYVGNAGAELSFTPDDGCTVSVARAIVGTNSLTYGGFSTNGVTVDSETGEVTVTGLKQGRHIIRVEKDGVATYQVVTTKQTSYTISDAQGNVITDKTPVLPGTELTIQFGDLYNPVNKLAGVYNSNCALYYTGEDGTVFEGSNGGTVFGFYVFAADPNLHKITVTVPTDWNADTYRLEGCFKIGGFGGGGGGHRGILLYETGRNVNNEAEGASGNPGVLPTITIPVTAKIPAEEITLNSEKLELQVGETANLVAEIKPADSTEEITWKSSNPDVATVEDGKVTAVGAGTATITVTTVDGGKTAVCEVTVKQHEQPEIPEGEATVYFSVSHDAEFLTTDTGKVMALQKVTVPYFDLTPYGLEDFSLPESHEGYGKPTMLHLYIYATEMFQYGVSPEEAGKGYLKDYIGSPMFAYSGSPGSICMDQFWGMDMNLNYYHNYVFPADESGYGITADRVVLEDGDIVTIGHFTSWSFFGDSSSIFNYLVADGDTVETTAAQNDELNLQVYRAGPNLGTGGSNTPVEAERDICYVKAGELSSGDVTTWTKLGTTDATGKLAAGISDLPVGKYILAVAGQKGLEYPDDIVSTPGGMILNVTESTLSAAVQAVIAQIKAIGEVTLEKENAVTAARSAYDALSDAEKELVSSYDILEAAEKTLEELRQGQAAIQTVMDKIDAIGDVTLDSATKIQEARDAYDALTEAQKELVTNYETLTAAEAALAVLKAAEADKEAARTVINLIEGIGEVILESGEEIEAAREAYNALTESQKELVTNYEILTEAEETLRLLKLGDADIANMYQTTGKYLSELEIPGVGSINGEWRVIGLARAGRSVPAAYYDAAVAYVKENIDADGRLHPAKSSDNSRLILALTSIGKDVTDVGGYDLLSGLDQMAYIGNQGLNGYIWALLAFDSHDYPIPSGDVSRDALVDAILTKQLSDGGWALAGTVSDPDMTGMALAALAPYQSEAPVAEAVEKALACLSNMQNADGTFPSVTEGTTCESLAQVVTGLTALGINPETDSRFVKNGISAADAFASFYVEAGGFRHGLTGQRNMMATEQGYYALASYYRLLEGKTALYDMSDVTIETSAANQEAANEVIGLINTIGTVDLTKEDEINAARAAYDSLTETQKELVTNYKTLTDAETELARQKQTAADASAADTVKQLIDAIGTVDLTKEDKIEAARSAYNRLTTLQKNLVGADYLEKLKNAEATLKEMQKDAEDEAAVRRVIEQINKIDTNPNENGVQINKNSAATIQTARNAYNALENDTLRGRVTNRQTLFDAEKAWDAQYAGIISVTFTLKGCSKHGTNGTVHTLADGNLNTWITKTCSVKSGATVKDLLELVLDKENIKNPTGNYVESIRYNGVWLGEFDNGQNSGWMYTLNGKHPGLGVNQQKLSNGDVVIFHYTDDFRKEEEDNSNSDTEGSNSTGGSTTNIFNTSANTVSTELAETVERLIEDIGEEITLDSEDKILAARAAYDKLTEAQKKLVENYDLLVAAEAALAELKGTSFENVYLETGDYLQGLGTPGVGTIGGEWMVIGLARSGRPVPSGYYDHVLNYVRENINDAEQLHSAKSSDNSRLILALTAIGKDVTNVDGHDLLKGLNDMDYIQKQGINGPIWALLAFDSGNYPVPEGNVSRDKLIDVILEAQLSDGGWALSGERSDPDMTGMAIQALAPYMESNMDVRKAVEEAIWTLSKMQNDNGSFTSVDGPNSESIAQVIVALTALGIDADTDARFVKNGISAMDALLTYYIPGGGFRHILDGNLDGMSTEQAFYALVAYERMKQSQNFLYDMTDVVDAGGDVIVEETTEPTEAPTEPVVEEEEDNGNNVVIWTGVMSLCAAAIAVLLLNRKKLFGKF